MAARLAQTLSFEPELPADSSTELRAILSHPKYAGGEPDAGQSSLLEKFLDWLGRLFRGTGLPMNNGWIVTLTGVIILAVLYLVIRVVWELVQRRGPRRKQAASEAVLEDMTAAGLIVAAASAAQRGDFRSAVRLRFMALVKQLGVPAASWRTNSQLARQVRKLEPAAAVPFTTAAARYEEIWYGGAAGSPEDFQTVETAAQQVVAALPAPSEAAT